MMGSKKSIQQILDDQKKESKIYTASNRSIAAQERNFNPEWTDSQQKANEKKRGKSWILDLKKNDPDSYAKWKEEHDKISKEVGQRPEFKEGSKQRAKSQWASEEGRNKKSQGIRNAYADPVVKANKSQSTKEVANRPDVYAKNLANIMDRARSVQTPDGIFESLTAVARHYKKAVGTIQYWMKTSKKNEFYYVD
jgi:hypothetical protein